ncbi:hypothetical protein [Bifidobacterium felsineum]|nr:hypothetical protein [Bifidobacterium felsineum]MBT1164591.1 hypothetical protein [Bifidobacterium felsineum]
MFQPVERVSERTPPAGHAAQLVYDHGDGQSDDRAEDRDEHEHGHGRFSR